MPDSQHARTVAAVDLGSNSFHLLVVRLQQGRLWVLDRLKETVRLAKGLDRHHYLDADAMARGIACLERFGQRLRALDAHSVRAVGTNTLRKARNAETFLQQAQQALGQPIDIIAGREEARLIYLGVAHTLGDDAGRRLVIDIGGGSTEFILGQGFEAAETESLHMGCVSITRDYFASGAITAQAWGQAHTAARLELRSIEQPYRAIGWDAAIGSSGSFLAVEQVLREMGWSHAGITCDGLLQLRDYMLGRGRINRLNMAGLSEDRKPIFIGGVVIVSAAFEALGLTQMTVSDGALREGVVYDLMGRFQHEDVRERTVAGLSRQFAIDAKHADRVAAIAQQLLARVDKDWACCVDAEEMLRWAARLHELGLTIAHNHYHKHGAYILKNADLPGFSRQEQRILATLVHAHRRKVPRKVFKALPEDIRAPLQRLMVLLRLAVLLRRGRSDEPINLADLRTHGMTIAMQFEPGWLDSQPLTRADLEQEQARLTKAGITLEFA